MDFLGILRDREKDKIKKENKLKRVEDNFKNKNNKDGDPSALHDMIRN